MAGFRATYPNASKFKYIVQTIVKLMDEVPFIAKGDGLEVKALTPDKTTMIVLALPFTAFEDYSVEGDKVSFIVASDELNRVAKRGTRNDLVELKLDTERRRLEVGFIDRKTGITRNFHIALREGSVEELVEPQVELSVSVRMEASELKDIINDAKVVGDEIELIAYNDRLEAVTESAQKKYRAVLSEGEALLSISVEGSEPVRSKYSIDLLKAATKAASTAEVVTLEYGESLPLKIIFELPGGGTLTYWVSPRM